MRSLILRRASDRSTFNVSAPFWFCVALVFLSLSSSSAFQSSTLGRPKSIVQIRKLYEKQKSSLYMAQVSEQEAKVAIDKVVAALRKDAKANEELGRLDKVQNVLGFGSPAAGSLAVRFNASFKKGGFGLASTPLPFGLGQSNKSEGRGQMVGQVKAAVDMKTGKITSCSVFRDLGYGRAFNLKV